MTINSTLPAYFYLQRTYVLLHVINYAPFSATLVDQDGSLASVFLYGTVINLWLLNAGTVHHARRRAPAAPWRCNLAHARSVAVLPPMSAARPSLMPGVRAVIKPSAQLQCALPSSAQPGEVCAMIRFTTSPKMSLPDNLGGPADTLFASAYHCAPTTSGGRCHLYTSRTIQKSSPVLPR